MKRETLLDETNEYGCRVRVVRTWKGCTLYIVRDDGEEAPLCWSDGLRPLGARKARELAKLARSPRFYEDLSDAPPRYKRLLRVSAVTERVS